MKLYRCNHAVCKIEAQEEAEEEHRTKVIIGTKKEHQMPDYKQEWVPFAFYADMVVAFSATRTKCGLSGTMVYLDASQTWGHMIDTAFEDFEKFMREEYEGG